MQTFICAKLFHRFEMRNNLNKNEKWSNQSEEGSPLCPQSMHLVILFSRLSVIACHSCLVIHCLSFIAFQAHVVAAFEQSLSSMTTRLQALTHSAEKKDSELTALHTTIEALKTHSSAIKANAIATGAMPPVRD